MKSWSMSAWVKYMMLGKLLFLQDTHGDEQQQAHHTQQGAEHAGVG